MNPEDRISDLPDCILNHILSFSPTMDAVRTSALSKRWMCLYLGLQNILIDGNFTLNTNETSFDRNDLFNMSVFRFVIRRLTFHEETPIFEFRLRCQALPEPVWMSTWLSFLFSSRIKVLDLKAREGSISCEFPSAADLQSSTLETLRLAGRGIIFTIPTFALFPNLKVLKLKYLEIQSDSKNYRFAHEFYPLLEELRLVEIRFPQWDFISTLGISLQALKKLEIVYRYSEDELSTIEVDAPNLQQLKFKIYSFLCSVKICWCESIMSADLHFSNDDYGFDVLRNIRNVKELHLTKGNWNLDTSFPQFINLTHLELAGIEVESMWSLLQRAPNLQSLIYEMDCTGEVILPHNDAPMCLAQSLKEIKLWNLIPASDPEEEECITDPNYFDFGYDFAKDDFELVRFFLQHGAVLEKMIIEYPIHMSDLQFPMIQDLDRLSPKCEVVFQMEYDSTLWVPSHVGLV